jgi:uncharacterized protein DUF3108
MRRAFTESRRIVAVTCPRAALRMVALVAALALIACSSSRFAGRPLDAVPIFDAALYPPPPPAGPVADEKLAYSIALSGLPVGSASFSTRVQGGEVEMVAEGGTNSVVDLLYPVKGLARSRLDESGASRTFFLSVDENGKANERALSYLATPCLFYRPWNEEAWVAVLAQFRAPIDPLALLLKLRRLDPDSQPHDFEVAMTMRSFCYRARCVDRCKVEVPAGDFADAWIWRIEVRPYEQLSSRPDDEGQVGAILGFYEVAISADARRLPLQLTREFGFGEVQLKLRSFETSPAIAAVPADGAEEAGGGVEAGGGAY